jgi:uncharacterized membrane protein
MAANPNSATAARKLVPLDELKSGLQDFLAALAERSVQSVSDRVTDVTGRLTDYANNGGGPGLAAALTGAKAVGEGKSPVTSAVKAGMTGAKEKVKDAVGGGGGNGSQSKKSLKVTNIVEEIDVGLPVRDVYNLWTQFADFPSFMKKVESVDQEEDETLSWRAQILWSHRDWKATITEQVPDERIVWQSEGSKGHVDGAVSFHEVAPNLTRILLVLEYYPQGFFEYTGNLWRAQGRRARLELKHFRRHAMTNAVLNSDEIEGWRGEIRDGEVVKDHETALDDEQDRAGADDAGLDHRDADDESGDDDADDEAAQGRGRETRRGRSRSEDGPVRRRSRDEDEDRPMRRQAPRRGRARDTEQGRELEEASASRGSSRRE